MCLESTGESEPSYLTVAQLAQRLQVNEVRSTDGLIGITSRSSLQEISSDLTQVRFTIEADRKREKKRGLREVRGKVTPAPGGCNRKGAIG